MPPRETPNFALRRFVVGVLATFIVGAGVGVPAAILAPVPQARAEVARTIDRETAEAKPVLPDFGATAIGAVDLPGVLARSGDDRPRSMASITKVVTALVVLERRPIPSGENGPRLTLTRRDELILSDVMARDGSWEEVHAGWRVSERAAIETMLIPSANNYAETLAVWAYGSVPEYLAAARAYLQRHGLDDTTIVDTNGLDRRDRSSPSDLIDLGRLALAEPVIASAVRKATATEPNVGELENTNKLLGVHGINGIKTGTSDDAGSCLLFSADVKVDGRRVRLIGVILGARTHPQLDARVPALLASVRRGLHDLPLADPGTAFATYRTRWGGEARAVPAEAASMLVWGRTRVQREADVKAITGGRRGERVGTVTYRVEGRTVTVPLVLDRDVLAAPVWWRLTHPLR